MVYSENEETLTHPEVCDETTEYNDRILNFHDEEIESEDDNEDLESILPKEEVVQQFTRFERNFRARRIRELTSPRRSRRNQTQMSKKIAA